MPGLCGIKKLLWIFTINLSDRVYTGRAHRSSYLTLQHTSENYYLRRAGKNSVFAWSRRDKSSRSAGSIMDKLPWNAMTLSVAGNARGVDCCTAAPGQDGACETIATPQDPSTTQFPRYVLFRIRNVMSSSRHFMAIVKSNSLDFSDYILALI